ncbi:MAG: hypothetical protein AAB969_03305 [Patescibacteria group bacterium]|mgnify:CR=1 FL=1
MKLKKIIGLFLIIIFSLVLVQSVSAASLNLVSDTLSKACKEGVEGCNLCDFVGLFITGANILVGLSGTFAILMFVYGGITMITAYGNEARIKWGKDILISTVIGIFIVLFAWTFINLIIGALLGNSNFNWANSNGVCSGQQGGG